MLTNISKTSVSTLERALAFAGAFAVTAAVIFVRQVNPTSSSLFPACPLHSLTGLNCPGCGATRGMHALLNGDVLAALDYNVLLVGFVPLMIYGFVVLISLGVRGRAVPPPIYFPQLIFGFSLVLLAFGVLRNLPFYPFTILAP